MPSIQTVEDAARKVGIFLERYYSYRRLKVARKQDVSWYVEFDVGILIGAIAKMTVDSETGAITSYEVVEG